MGYYYSCDVLTTKGCSFTVEWGDGKSDQRWSNGEWISLIHEYPKSDYREELPYRICVHTEEEGALIGFREGGSEVDTQKLDTSRCPSLQYLTYHDLTSLDVSRNRALKMLDCSRSEIETLTLDNPALEVLNCSFSRKLTTLNLSRCPALRILDSQLCSRLSRLGLSNQSVLRLVDYGYTALTGKVEEHLLRIIRQNEGEVIECFAKKHRWLFGRIAQTGFRNSIIELDCGVTIRRESVCSIIGLRGEHISFLIRNEFFYLHRVHRKRTC